MATLVRTIVDAHATEVEASLHQVVEALAGSVPEAAGHLEQAPEGLLAFRHCRRGALARATGAPTLDERLHTQITQSTDVAGIVPDRSATIRLLGSLLLESTSTEV